ncbi:MAG: alpha-amylase family glycosyl hydrolase [Caulobacteraceae bacterium]
MALDRLYGHLPGHDAWLDEVSRQVRGWAARRRPELRALDGARGGSAAWLQAPRQIGYSFYVDRFAGDLPGLIRRLPYLRELGVTYAHPLPLLRARDGDSDGGFAVADFRNVEPALGTVADLAALADALHREGMALILDVVCNHTAAEHAWAKAARAGDPTFRDYYHVIRTRAEVEALEADLIDVFPGTAPGSFTWSPELDGWVWTTFHDYQWDLNYANPAVFAEMLDVLLFLADLGVDGFRLDSTAFLWKRAGTASRNEPECHLILQAWRALVSMVAPSVVFKAEAIERMETVLPFFGADAAPECDIAYSNGVMAALWASLGLERAGPMRDLLAEASEKPARATWLNYVRCHDDLIWSALSPHVSAADQRRVSGFFSGAEPGSYAAGAPFQTLGEGVPSTNGMAADLCGVGRDPKGLDRLMLLYSVCFAIDGLPAIYMGDEIALPNNHALEDRPLLSVDGRWLHRPRMDWAAAERRGSSQAASRMFRHLQTLAGLRAATPAFRGDLPALPVGRPPESVLSFSRGGPDGVVCAANFSARSVTTTAAELGAPSGWLDLITGEVGDGEVMLAPYQARWLAERR